MMLLRCILRTGLLLAKVGTRQITLHFVAFFAGLASVCCSAHEAPQAERLSFSIGQGILRKENEGTSIKPRTIAAANFAPQIVLTDLRFEINPITLETNLITFLEDNPSCEIYVTIIDPDTPTNDLRITLQSANPDLVPTLNLYSKKEADGLVKIIFSPVKDANGEGDILLIVNDGATQVHTNIHLRLLPVNDPPDFMVQMTNVVVEAGSGMKKIPLWVYPISSGAPDELSQVVAFYVTNNNPDLFKTQPRISSVGTLEFEPIDTITATTNATLTVRLMDKGGTADGGNDTSTDRKFTITVLSRGAPTITFSQGTNYITIEDTPVLVSFKVDSPRVPLGNLRLSATSSSPSLVPESPDRLKLDPQSNEQLRTIIIVPAPNENGTVDISITVSDGRPSIGEVSGVFRLLVTPENDPPIFNAGPSQQVFDNQDVQTITNWATNISVGPKNEETSQRLTGFTLSTDRPDLFAIQPQVDLNGTLKYKPQLKADGTAKVTIFLSDSGVGANTSDPQNFTVKVTHTNVPPSVRITSPINNSKYNILSDVALLAKASDQDGNVSKVEFFANGILVGSSFTPDMDGVYRTVWTVQQAGTYDLRASVTDDEGTSVASTSVRIIATESRFGLILSINRVQEDGGTITATVTNIGGGSANIRLRTVNVSARAAVPTDPLGDFFPVNTNLVFKSTDTKIDVPVIIIDDLLEEPEESFQLVLESDSSDSSVNFDSSPQIVTIIDNDNGLYSVSATNHVRRPVEFEQVGEVFVQIAGPEGVLPDKSSKWRFGWETVWHTNNENVVNVPVGEHKLSWWPVRGQSEPTNDTVMVMAGKQTSVSATYRWGTFDLSSLRVTVSPDDLASGWKIVGDTDSIPHKSGDIVPVPPGTYLVDLVTRPDLNKPPPRVVTVPLFGVAELTVNYTPSVGENNQFNTVVEKNEISTALAIEPVPHGYPFVGQVWTTFGWGTAFAVSERVILTAAHLVYGQAGDKYRESDFLYWFPQRNGPRASTGRPRLARGWYISPSYANFVDSPNKFEGDFAAVYFDEPVVSQGWGGYLVSLNPPRKLESPQPGYEIVGYPVRGASPDYQMYRRLSSIRATEVFSPRSAHLEFAGPGTLHGLPGASGGPVYIVPDSTYPNVFMPAGIYLGEDESGYLVRLIDREVVEQIQKAVTAAYVSTNHGTGGFPGITAITLRSGPAVVCRVHVTPPGIFGLTDNIIVSRTAADNKSFVSQDFNTLLETDTTNVFHFPVFDGFYPDRTNVVISPLPGNLQTNIVVHYTPNGELGLRVAALYQSGTIPLIIGGLTYAVVSIQIAESAVGPWVEIARVNTGAEGIQTYRYSPKPGPQSLFFRTQLAGMQSPPGGKLELQLFSVTTNSDILLKITGQADATVVVMESAAVTGSPWVEVTRINGTGDANRIVTLPDRPGLRTRFFKAHTL